jgi:FkbM family methyltransferase
MVERREVQTVEGTFWVDPASYQGLRILKTGVYEPEMIDTLRRYLSPGDTFVDLGANEGYFSVVGAKIVGPRGRVISIEPQERIQPVLKKNFELNLVSPQITLVAAAVSDAPGEAHLHLTPGVNNSASSLIQPTRYRLETQPVRTATLEQILTENGVTSCGLIKIDIEGWEWEAILGSRAFFKEKRAKAIALEIHPHLLAARKLNADDIMDFLKDCGYKPVIGSENLVLVLPN